MLLAMANESLNSSFMSSRVKVSLMTTSRFEYTVATCYRGSEHVRVSWSMVPGDSDFLRVPRVLRDMEGKGGDQGGDQGEETTKATTFSTKFIQTKTPARTRVCRTL